MNDLVLSASHSLELSLADPRPTGLADRQLSR